MISQKLLNICVCRERERERETCRRRGCQTKEVSLYWFIGTGEKRWKNAWDVLLDMSARTYCTVYSQRRILPKIDITTFQSPCSVDIKLSTRERQVGIRLRHQRLGDCHVDPVRFSKPRALCCLIAILQDSFNNFFLSKMILFELIKTLLFCN